ncbi:MAG: chloride channel protein [Synechococcaceae cyanobacterium]|nr:chloride channel protein [Synechococcaceae cyanobacterium]
MRLHPAVAATGRRFLQLALLGLLVGVACWPFNLLDHWQDQMLKQLPLFTGEDWGPTSLALAALPLLLMPLLLVLQAGAWRRGAGSGIPQTMVCLEQPALAPDLLSPAPTLQRLLLWSIATVGLLPLGREGPVVQMGAAVASWLRRRHPGLLAELETADLVAVAGGAGLAAGFNTPLMGTIFVAEELTARFQVGLIWPALLSCAVAAGISNLGGQPEFALGLLRVAPGEGSQLFWAVPVGLLAGLLGALFARLLLQVTAQLTPLARRHPLRIGLALGLILSLFLLLSQGASGGDGEALMGWMINRDAGSLPWLQHLVALLTRLIGPCLALGAGVPGGLIDPAFALGALFGQGVSLFGGASSVGLALGMTAGLAGATQLPVLSIVFALRLAGDQQLLPGMLLAAVLGAYMSRMLGLQPVYHALTHPLREALGLNSLPG